MKYKILIAVLLYSIFQTQSMASLDDFKTATWNLQGSSAATESKWNINIRHLIQNDGIQILAVQEAGAVPTTATAHQVQLGANTLPRLTNPTNWNPPNPVMEYRWNLGTTTRPNYRYIYYIHNDTGANRVNLALVTDRQAEEVILLEPVGNFRTARPALGVRFGNDFFFTVHAGMQGNDAADTVQAVRDHINARPNNNTFQWMVMGDFNTEPRDFQQQLPQGTTIVHQDVPTHQAGRNLDYAVVGNAAQAVPLIAALFIARISGMLGSDHYPVRFF